KSLAEFLDIGRKTDPTHFADLSLAVIKLLGRGEYIANSPGKKTDGHFALAVEAYSHSTAPNRRYADLLMQRLIKASLAQSTSPYSVEPLNPLAVHCNEREDAAAKVRRVFPVGAVHGELIELFDGIRRGALGQAGLDESKHLSLFRRTTQSARRA